MTTSSPPTSSDPPVWEALHPTVQRWIWDQGWPSLRPVQELAIPHVHDADQDVLITAGTAGGKTEAAWLPIASRLAFDAEQGLDRPGVKALYVGPLKALINDQAKRLTTIFERLDLPVRRRHADVSGEERDAATGNPDGVLLITPEALEALIMLNGHRIGQIFSGLRFVVIDELHAFISTERGAQLQSLLHRIELAIRRRVPRIALSATIADPAIATNFLRPDPGARAVVITPPAGSGTDLQLQVRGYVESDSDDIATNDIAAHLFKHLRGSNNLVFANSRRNVEMLTARLNELSNEAHVPLEFFAHHGSMDKSDREFLEARLKKGDRPTTAVATSTLEMGIDIGSVSSVAQVGSAGNVASLRQRLGRSGRRGTPTVLRVYVTEQDDPEHPADQLRLHLIESMAVVELLLEHWLEPPNTRNLHLSTLVQQILSLIAQHSGIRESDAYSVLCSHGPFAHVHQNEFNALIQSLLHSDVILQDSEGLLLGTPKGERMMNHYSFYTAFQTTEEYRLLARNRQIGTLPVSSPIIEGGLLVFGGHSWRIDRVDSRSKTIELSPAQGGAPPRWGGSAIPVHDGIRRKMREILISEEVSAYLNATARELLHQAREAWRSLGLDQRGLVGYGNASCLFPWAGDTTLNTMQLMLHQYEIESVMVSGCLEMEADEEQVMSVVRAITTAEPPDPLELAALVADRLVEKHDSLLSESLQNLAIATRDVDVPSAMAAFAAIAEADATSR